MLFQEDFFMAVDVRTRYTRSMIQSSFVKLLKEKPIDKITVKEICDSAQINRSTFYKHYRDIYDVQEKIEDELREAAVEMIKNIQKTGIKEAFSQAIGAIRDNLDFYLAVFLQKNTSDLVKFLLEDYFKELNEESDISLPDVSKENRDYILHYISWGCAGIINCWIKNGMKDSNDSVAELIEKLIENAVEFSEKLKF